MCGSTSIISYWSKTKFDIPKAVFCGLALLAAAIYFGPGAVPAEAYGNVEKVMIVDDTGADCARDLNSKLSVAESGMKANAAVI